MKQREVPRRAAKVYQVEDFIALVDAITLLAERDRRKNDSDRVRKARTRQRINYAVDNELAEVLRNGTRGYLYGRLIAWAQDKWPGKYSDLAATRGFTARQSVVRSHRARSRYPVRSASC